jgi:hypothetical protein
MDALVVPSWYPQFENDFGGSFFREQAITLARLVEQVGIVFPNQRSLRELWNPNHLNLKFITSTMRAHIVFNAMDLTCASLREGRCISVCAPRNPALWKLC